MFGIVDILRIIGILAFGTFCGWVLYRLMKNADANEEDRCKLIAEVYETDEL